MLRPLHACLRHCACAAIVAALLMVGHRAAAQQGPTDPIDSGPRGMTQLPPWRAELASSAAAAAAAPATAAATAVRPLPANPVAAGLPVVFGSQIFSGRLSAESSSGFNPDYQIAAGDRVSLRMWGAFSFEAVQAVDAQGNVFVPNVGPIKVQGVRNGDLGAQVEAQVKRVFRANVGVYANLESAQPIKVYVTGFVRAPGLYGGLSSDSVLYYLDKAGGIDPDRGSYLEVDVLRGGVPRAKLNLYRFLLQGDMPGVQLRDGDTIVARWRKHTVKVSGEALNPYIFEFESARLSADDVIQMARPTPNATHLSIVRKAGAQRRSEYVALSRAGEVMVEDGDELTLTADKYPGTLLVRIEGAHLGERTLVMPYGSRLEDAMARLRPAPQANVEATQLFRRSVAARQKEMLDMSLRSLETYALTARSATSEEAALRTREAELILQFIERARGIQPKGQVILSGREAASRTLLEDGDVLRVPERSNLVLVSGEVLFPNSLVHDPRAGAEDYVRQAGGYTHNADASKLVLLHQDGSVADAARAAPLPGDEILVLPKIDTKRVEITRGITQIVYQIAVAAKIAFGL